MVRRGGWWRSIPPEIGVPIAISGVIQLVIGLTAGPRGLSAASITIATAPAILVLCGLRELRRRLVGTAARLVGVAIVVQAVTVAQLAVSWFRYPLGIDPRIWLAITLWALPVEQVCLALVVGIAARAWRSVTGLVLVVALVLDYGPLFMERALSDVLDRDAIFAYIAVSQFVHKVAMLAIYARLGSVVEASPEQARAVRAARRAAISQWLQAGSIAIGIGLSVALEVLGVAWLSDGVFGVTAIAIVATTVGTTSGLLGLARAHIVGLSPLAMCTAAFGALWLVAVGEVQVFWAYFGKLGAGAGALLTGQTLASLLCVACAAVAIRGYAKRLGDRPLASVLSRRLALIVTLDLAVVGCLALARPGTLAGIAAVVGSLLVLYTAVHVVLAGVFTRLRHRLKVAQAVDAF
jgi:hypothetical protein